MQSFNFHTHTKRCGHATGEEEAYVKAAIEAGYKVLGFSDHAPYKQRYSWDERMHEDEYPLYCKEVRRLQEVYKDQIQIYLGLEIEYYEEQLEELKAYREELDFCILGQHSYTVMGHNYFVDCDDRWVLVYANQIRKACEMGFVDIIAHPDLFMISRSTWSKACEEAARIICETSNRFQIPLELNLGGLRYGKKQKGKELRYVYPYRPLWEIVAEYGCPVIYGLDAHSPEYVGRKDIFKIADEVVKDLPLNFLKEFKPMGCK
ncbi:MAG: histidinol-phosphatase [Erysipelotrichaceae bacterium]|nr:histidinol-phosphatase [Erysipelotrichaceae bacterium]